MAENAGVEILEQIKKQRSEEKEQKRLANKKRAKRLISNLIIITVVLTVLGVWFSSMGMYYFALLFMVGLLPGLVAYITDTRHKKLASKTVMAFNISGIIPPVTSVFLSGSPDQAALSAISSVETWFMIYGFAFIGWAMVYLVPHITQLYLEIRADFMVKRLEARQKELLEEWGERIKR